MTDVCADHDGAVTEYSLKRQTEKLESRRLVDELKAAHRQCVSFRGRFHQYFVSGDWSDCSQLEDCRRLMSSAAHVDPEALIRCQEFWTRFAGIFTAQSEV